MNVPTIYGIYTAQFPFVESREYKLRPVVVASKPYGQHNIVAVVPVSSNTTELELVDSAISDWEVAGLAISSTARVHRLTAILESRLITQLGVLAPADVKKLKQSIREFLEL